MSKLVGLSGMDQFKSPAGSCSSYSNSPGSFTNLKLAAEKLAKELASAKTDLDLASMQNSKIKTLSENISVLEDKLQNAYNEKENVIKNFEATVASNKSAIDSLSSKLSDLQLELISKEDRLKNMQDLCEKKEKENTNLIASKKNICEYLVNVMQEYKNLQIFLEMHIHFEREQIQRTALEAQQILDSVHGQLLNTTSEKDALQLVNKELKNKINELQKNIKFTMAQLLEECHPAEVKVNEKEYLILNKAKMDNLITTVEDKIRSLSEACRISETEMLKHSESETDNKETIKTLQSEINLKKEEIDSLKNETIKHEEKIDLLQISLQEKEQVIKEKEKQLEDQKAEKLLVEANKKQLDHMLTSNQLEMSRHKKELCQKNAQAISDIERRYEVEKQKCVNLEKEKAEKAIVDMEKNLLECKEESKQQLMKIEGEHTALVNKIRQENDKKEAGIRSSHSEELKRMQIQAENTLEEKTKLLKNQHEAELRELRSQYEEKLNIQDFPYMNATQPPLSKKLETASIPKHSKKVTCHEYGLETSHGTIAKRHKTKSTILLEDSKKNTPKVKTPRDAIARMMGGSQQTPHNIGEDPNANDPYAFD